MKWSFLVSNGAKDAFNAPGLKGIRLGLRYSLHLKYDAAVSDHADAKNENELNKYRRTEAQAREAAAAVAV